MKILEGDITNALPPKFGLMFDGWSEDGVHYFAVFAVGEGVPNSSVLLGFSPFEDETDLSAEEHERFLKSILVEIFKRSINDIQYLVGDNVSVNQKLSKSLKIPLIGCNSHKLNLAVTLYLGLKKKKKNETFNLTTAQAQRKVLILKLTELMKKLKTIKGKAALRKFNENYVALKPNDTRWDGNFRMIDRFIVLHESINSLILAGGTLAAEIDELMPSTEQIDQIRELHKSLTKFQSVSTALQYKDGTITLLEVRELFDHLIQEFGSDFKKYLAPDAAIVTDPVFEKAIVGHLRRTTLSAVEKKALKTLIRTDAQTSSEKPLKVQKSNYASSIIESLRSKQVVETKYVDMAQIPVTSNIVERFFSAAKLNLTPKRNRLHPTTLESIMFLKFNSHMFTKDVVHRALNSLEVTLPEDIIEIE